MKTQVQFRSDKFPPYDGEEAQINPGIWGKRLAEYLSRKLGDSGFKTKKPIPEDWGWLIPIVNDRFRLAVGCGRIANSDNDFLCFVIPNKPYIWRWFRLIDTTDVVGRVTEALNEILSSAPNINNIRWRRE